MERRDCDALVVVGATGDLSYRKIFPALYHLVRRRLLNIPVVGVARAGWNTGQLADRVRKSVTDFVKDRDEEVVQRFVSLLKYVDGGCRRRAAGGAGRGARGAARRPRGGLA